jgi:hypothetical protein
METEHCNFRNTMQDRFRIQCAVSRMVHVRAERKQSEHPARTM